MAEDAPIERAPPKAVLCVDDDRVPILVGLLERLGFVTVAEATRGIDTVTFVAEHDPDVVIIDLAQVGGLGLRIFSVIEALAPECLRIALSPMDTLDLAALEAGANAVIPDGDLRRLRRVLTTLTRSRREVCV
jgi:CheY-like chemotaxis protein